MAIAALFAAAHWFPAKDEVQSPTYNTCETTDQKANSSRINGEWSPEAKINAWIAGFTAILAISTIALWFSTRKAALVAERALTVLERPHISLRITVQDIGPELSGVLGTAEFMVFNLGRTPAEIESLQAVVIVTEDRHPPISETLFAIGLEDLLIGASENIVLPYDLVKLMTDKACDIDHIPGKQVFLQGLVLYTDVFNADYETGFTLRFDRKNVRFTISGGKKHNYTKRYEKK